MAMIDFGVWAHALAMVETGDNWRLWGDSGQAMGRWQMHPSFLWEYGPDTVGLAVTYDDVCHQTLVNFFAERSRVCDDPIRLAMEFHLGVGAVAKGKWDDAYARRFHGFYSGAA